MKDWNVGVAILFLALVDVGIFLSLLCCEVLIGTFK